MLLNEIVEVIENLALTFGEWQHSAPFSRTLRKGKAKVNPVMPVRRLRLAGEGTPFAKETIKVTYVGKDRRQHQGNEAELEPVVLKKKFADALNGIALAGFNVGDRLVLARRQAAILIAEGWACPVPASQRRRLA